MTTNLQNAKLAVLGLGYVGLPLAVEFAKQRSVVAFDINPDRIAALQAGRDDTREVSVAELADATGLQLTANTDDLAGCNTYIVTVPTPIDEGKTPDLGPVSSACETIGKVLSIGDTVIFESTVYPGCTEDVCVPILERVSELAFNREFFVGYSPERMNPGDKNHTVTTITKVTSGSTPQTTDYVDALYASIVTAGTHKAPSIKVAEAAKVIENTQRDVNVALVNELAVLFHRLGIDTLDVLEAAGTKWNFLPFRPGLVGGHCIGVDPYYLTHKAQSVGHHAEMILAGRRTNDGVGRYVANRTIRLMIQKGINPVQAKVLILGFTFKENCPDIRNTRVIDIVHALQQDNIQAGVHDPWVNPAQMQQEYDITPVDAPASGTYDAIIVAVGHDEFKQLGAGGIRALGKSTSVLFDTKSVFPKQQTDGRL